MTATSTASTRSNSPTPSSDPRTSTSLAGPGSGSSSRTVTPMSCVALPTHGTRGPNDEKLAQPLDDHRHALAAADAHRLKTERLVLCREVVQQRGGDPCARHAERVTQRDRPTGHVEVVLVDAELPRRAKHLHREPL